MADVLRVSRSGPTAVLTLNRPEKLNALSNELEEALGAALAGDEVRDSAVVIVAGEDRAFCAGADVSEFSGNDPASILSYYSRVGDVYERCASLPQPTIAAIHGYCLGGGLELALACDFRVASSDAVLGLPEVSIGILPSSGGTVRLVRAVGPVRAKELVLLRDRVSASEALAFGLVTEVVASGGDALSRALEMASSLAALPPLAVRVAKASVEALAGAPREAGLLIERFGYGMLAQTKDAEEAANAFVEKREPKFKGR